jgi:hypothetical protein
LADHHLPLPVCADFLAQRCVVVKREGEIAA